MITAEQIAEWRALQGEGMNSAVGEYTPHEFWDLLTEFEAQRDVLIEARKWIDGQPARSTCKYTTQYELEAAIDAALGREQ